MAGGWKMQSNFCAYLACITVCRAKSVILLYSERISSVASFGFCSSMCGSVAEIQVTKSVTT